MHNLLWRLISMSDVLMIPVATVQPDLVTQTDVVVYVPLASKNAPGIVKIGEGLNITNSGLLSLDFEEIDDKINQSAQILTNEISIVNEDLQAHKNNFDNPHRVTKAQVGLGNVENTADADKPVSNAVRAELLQLDNKLTNHINDYNNPHRVTKSQVGLSNVDNTSDLEKPISTKVNNELILIKNDIKKVEALLEGQSNALALDNYSEVVETFNAAATNEYKVGQIILVNTTDVPDLWVFSVENTHVDYAYVGDYDIVEQLEEHGTVQFGYYKLAQMESKSVDLENYVNVDGMQTITGVKLFREQLGIVNPENGDVNLFKHINDNFLISASNGENIINIDEQLKKFYFYNKPVALEENVITKSGAVVDNFSLTVPTQRGGLFVTDNNVQSGFIRNGKIALSTVNEDSAQLAYRATNESVIQVIDGEVNLKILGNKNSVVKLTENEFTYNDNKILTEDVLGANYVSYTESQNLTDEQKEIARNNIGAGTGSGTGGGTIVTVNGEPQTEWSADTKVDSVVTNDYGEGRLRIKPTGVAGRAPSMLFETVDNELGKVTAFAVDDSEISIINMDMMNNYSQMMIGENVVIVNKKMDDSAQSTFAMSPEQIDMIVSGKVNYNGDEIATVKYIDSLIKTTLNTEV